MTNDFIVHDSIPFYYDFDTSEKDVDYLGHLTEEEIKGKPVKKESGDIIGVVTKVEKRLECFEIYLKLNDKVDGTPEEINLEYSPVVLFHEDEKPELLEIKASMKMWDEEEKSGESGTHIDNDLTEVQEIMQDNDLPTFYSTEKEDEEDDDKQEEP